MFPPGAPGTPWAYPHARFYAVLVGCFVAIFFPVGLTGNEETVLSFALKSVDPAAFPPQHALFYQHNVAFMFNMLAGTLIEWIGYEPTQFVLRMLQAVLYAVAFGMLLRALRIELLTGLVALAGFLLLERKIPGAEWLFFGVESKTFAYTLVFVSLAFVIENRWKPAVAAAGLASYFHFLVGGFWAAAACVLLWLVHRDRRSVTLFAATYAAVTAPLFLYLAWAFLAPSPAKPAGFPDADFIYTFIRHPHHTAPFTEGGSLKGKWVVRTATLVFLVWPALWAWGRGRKKVHRAVALLVLGLFAYLALAFVLAWLDRHHGVLGKFYLFRPAALTLFLALLVCFATVHEWARETIGAAGRRVAWAGFVVVISGAVVFSSANKFHTFVTRGPDPDREAIAAVHRFTAEDDIVLVPPHTPVAKLRRLERPTYANWKLIPTRGEDIYRWYDRVSFLYRLLEQGCTPGNLAKVPFRAILVPEADVNPPLEACGKTVWSDGTQRLILRPG